MKTGTVSPDYWGLVDFQDADNYVQNIYLSHFRTILQMYLLGFAENVAEGFGNIGHYYLDNNTISRWFDDKVVNRYRDKLGWLTEDRINLFRRRVRNRDPNSERDYLDEINYEIEFNTSMAHTFDVRLQDYANTGINRDIGERKAILDLDFDRGNHIINGSCHKFQDVDTYVDRLETIGNLLLEVGKKKWIESYFMTIRYMMDRIDIDIPINIPIDISVA